MAKFEKIIEDYKPYFPLPAMENDTRVYLKDFFQLRTKSLEDILEDPEKDILPSLTKEAQKTSTISVKWQQWQVPTMVTLLVFAVLAIISNNSTVTKTKAKSINTQDSISSWTVKAFDLTSKPEVINKSQIDSIPNHFRP